MRAGCWLGVLVALGLATSLHSMPSAAAGASCPEPEPKTGNEWIDVADPRECELLAAYPGVARRDNLSLVLKLKNGTTVYYYDDEYAHIIECGNHEDDVEDCIIYRIWEVSPNRRYVTLLVGFYEGGAAYLIDRATGTELPLSSPPYLSPSGRYWAAVDEDYAYGTGEIAVIGRRSGRPSILASETRDYCEFEKWDTDSAFLITCYDFDAEARAELRVTWDKVGALIMTPTGLTIPGGL